MSDDLRGYLEDAVRNTAARADYLHRRVEGTNTSSQWIAAEAYVNVCVAQRVLREYVSAQRWLKTVA